MTGKISKRPVATCHLPLATTGKARLLFDLELAETTRPGLATAAQRPDVSPLFATKAVGLVPSPTLPGNRTVSCCCR